MHTITKTPITINNFETDDYCGDLPVYSTKGLAALERGAAAEPEWKIADLSTAIIKALEDLRQNYLYWINKVDTTNDPFKQVEYEKMAKKYWKELIRWNPQGWLQTRTWTANYETLLSICSKGQRRFHKLTEWSGKDRESFINFARSLPYAQDLIFLDEIKEEE